MRRINANEKVICKNIAYILSANPKKIEQLRTVQSISENCTSSDGIEITCELYSGSIVRYLIQGVRSSMTITANTLTNKIVRKRRGEQPWAVAEIRTYCSDIFEVLYSHTH